MMKTDKHGVEIPEYPLVLCITASATGKGWLATGKSLNGGSEPASHHVEEHKTLAEIEPHQLARHVKMAAFDWWRHEVKLGSAGLDATYLDAQDGVHWVGLSVEEEDLLDPEKREMRAAMLKLREEIEELDYEFSDLRNEERDALYEACCLPVAKTSSQNENNQRFLAALLFYFDEGYWVRDPREATLSNFLSHVSSDADTRDEVSGMMDEDHYENRWESRADYVESLLDALDLVKLRPEKEDDGMDIMRGIVNDAIDLEAIADELAKGDNTFIRENGFVHVFRVV